MLTIDARLLERIGAEETAGLSLPVAATAVTADSRRVVPGSLFVAIRGERADGHDHVGAALAAGALAAVVERPLASGAWIRVADTRLALGELAAAAAGDPTAALLLAGVTGTDGKTSTAMMIVAGMEGCGLVTGLLGTVVYRVAGVDIPSTLTTPDAPTLQALFARMRDAGVGGAAMEVSSHALDQRRVDACRFDVAAFTNLTRDHLDYHGTPEAYADAKLRFFSEILPSNPAARGAVVNHDDAQAARIRAACPLPVRSFSHGNPAADLRPIAVRHGLDGIDARLATPWGEFAFRSPLIGPHNLANAMAAIGVGGMLDLPLDRFVAGVAALARIPGRLERVAGRRDLTVFVDYAHTPKALENVLSVLRPLVGGAPLAVVFGAGGDRDRGKRPLMGLAAATLADRVIVTSDNPRSEDPAAIVAEIVAGIDQARALGTVRGRVDVVVDRRAAIEAAITGAAPGSVVVIAGKGHEDYQILGSERIRFSDAEVAREFLDA